MQAVLVDWIDSQSIDGWRFQSELPALGGKEIRTLGWMVEDGKEAIVVSASFANDPAQVNGTILIPRCCIQNIKNIIIE